MSNKVYKVNPFIITDQSRAERFDNLIKMIECMFCEKINKLIPIHTKNSSTIEFKDGSNGTQGNPLFPNVKISGNAGNILVIDSKGLYVPTPPTPPVQGVGGIYLGIADLL